MGMLLRSSLTYPKSKILLLPEEWLNLNGLDSLVPFICIVGITTYQDSANHQLGKGD